MLSIAFPAHTPLPEGARILAADVGGTKSDLALFEVRDSALALVREDIFPSRQFNAMTDIIRQFLGNDPVPDRLSIAFAGPVQYGKAFATNLNWHIDIREIQENLGMSDVFLLNDLEAVAYGLAALTPRDVRIIQTGSPAAHGNVAVIAPGTGLGEAGLFWDGSTHRPFATEGGHTDFAPRNAFDWELLRFLQAQFGHVSWERVLSGPGIFLIYRFLRDVKGMEEPAWVTAKMQEQDPSAVVGDSAREGCPISVETLRVFVRYLAVEASNLALKLYATGGVFIGGGIPPKIWNDDLQAVFMEHFLQVGRLRTLLDAAPVHLVLNPKTARLGAAYYGHG